MTPLRLFMLAAFGAAFFVGAAQAEETCISPDQFLANMTGLSAIRGHQRPIVHDDVRNQAVINSIVAHLRNISKLPAQGPDLTRIVVYTGRNPMAALIVLYRDGCAAGSGSEAKAWWDQLARHHRKLKDGTDA